MANRHPTIPYWRLSAFYFFHFATLGVVVPYLSIYLKSLGFREAAIGILIAVFSATKIVAPNLWAWLTERTGRRIELIRLSSLLAVVGFAAIYIDQSYFWLMGVVAVFGFFWNASLPQFETVTLGHLRRQVHRYGTIRLWGSVGFIVSAFGLGLVLEDVGPDAVPPTILLLLAGLLVASLLAPGSQPAPARSDGASRAGQGGRVVLALLAASFLMQASHGPYYTFFSIYLQNLGYTDGWIGFYWTIGVISEIGVFLVIHRWVPRFGLRALLLVSLALTGVRWTATAFLAQYPAPLALFQTLHAFSFGVYHAVVIQWIHVLFADRQPGQGQALYSSLGFGAGGAAGSAVSGYLWEGIGPAGMFLVAAGLAWLGLALAWRGLPGPAAQRRAGSGH